MKRDGANQLRSGLRRELLEGHLPLSADNRAALRRFNLKQLAVLTHLLALLVQSFNTGSLHLTSCLGH